LSRLSFQFSISVVLNIFETEQLQIGNWDKTRQNCLDFDLFAVIGMWFCTGLSNFIPTRTSATELWRHIDFPRWRPYRRKLTSVFL